MALLRTALAVLLAGLAVVLTATPAFAHTELKTSNPDNGATLSTAPDTVTLTFEEAVTLPKNPISVTGPDGSAWSVGTPTISGASVSAPVQPTGPAGLYTLHYTVTADDGDAVSGTVKFTLVSAPTPTTEAVAPVTEAAPVTVVQTAAPGTAAAPTTADTSSDSGSSPWIWVAVVVVLLGLGGAAYTITRRRRADGRVR